MDTLKHLFMAYLLLGIYIVPISLAELAHKESKISYASGIFYMKRAWAVFLFNLAVYIVVFKL